MVRKNKMAQLIKVQKIVTKDGECNINITLDLNIKLDSDGLSVSAVGSGDKNRQRAILEDDDQVDWAAAVPDFTNKPEKKKKKGIFKFGKNV